MNRKLKDRAKSLVSFISAFQIIKAEIVFRALPLPEIMQIIAAECRGAAAWYFCKVSELMSETGASFWGAGAPVAARLKDWGLREGDIRHISSALHALGRYDGATQAEAINTAVRSLETELEGARGELAQKGRLYGAMGVTVGIMVALVII